LTDADGIFSEGGKAVISYWNKTILIKKIATFFENDIYSISSSYLGAIHAIINRMS
jgi:hypothetical protein